MFYITVIDAVIYCITYYERYERCTIVLLYTELRREIPYVIQSTRGISQCDNMHKVATL